MRCFLYKKYNFIPVFISILHTYDRALNWNPHIHMILLDDGISKTNFKNINFFYESHFRFIGKNEFRQIKKQFIS